YSFDFAIDNHADQGVTIQTLDNSHSNLKSVYAPAKSDTVVFGGSGMGFAEIAEISTSIRMGIYGDSVKVTFDDGRYLKYYIGDDTNGGLYSFADTNGLGTRYRYAPRMNTRMFKGRAGYCRYTLVITNDDYSRSE
ncbi:MAG: hypothetical protein J6T03_00070, partial [Bacteroidales bacterium]|nr:hypothetical protein [Bacteroidales bacterium]